MDASDATDVTQPDAFVYQGSEKGVSTDVITKLTSEEEEIIDAFLESSSRLSATSDRVSITSVPHTVATAVGNNFLGLKINFKMW